MKASIVGLQ